MNKLISVRNKLIAEQFKNGASKEELAKKYDIGLTHLQTILREYGVIKVKPRQDLTKRNSEILQMFKDGKTPEIISAAMKLTVTRIQQILSKEAKAIREKELIEAKKKAIKLIADGKNMKEIEEAIGLQAIKRLKYRFNFRVFNLVVKRRNERVTELYQDGVKPTDIANILGCTHDYVYTLLRNVGIKQRKE